jgi:hypothetical protein
VRIPGDGHRGDQRVESLVSQEHAKWVSARETAKKTLERGGRGYEGPVN